MQFWQPQQLQSIKALIRSAQISILTPNINWMQLKDVQFSHTCLMTGMNLHIQWTEFTRQWDQHIVITCIRMVVLMII